MHRLEFGLFLGIAVLIFLTFAAWLAPNSLAEVVEHVDIKCPSITVLKPEMNETVRMRDDKVTIYAKVIVSDERGRIFST